MLHLVRCADHIIGHQLVTLPHQIKHRMFPLRGGEAAILGVQLVMPGLGERSQHLTPGIQRMFVGGQRIGGTAPKPSAILASCSGSIRGGMWGESAMTVA
jgi:hypothetical protein